MRGASRQRAQQQEKMTASSVSMSVWFEVRTLMLCTWKSSDMTQGENSRASKPGPAGCGWRIRAHGRRSCCCRCHVAAIVGGRSAHARDCLQMLFEFHSSCFLGGQGGARASAVLFGLQCCVHTCMATATCSDRDHGWRQRLGVWQHVQILASVCVGR
jgi:hypothetical protein